MSIGDAYLALEIRRGLRSLDVITAKIDQLEVRMATINEVLTGLAEGIGGLETDVQRLLDVLANEQLSPEAQQAADQLQQRVTTLSDTMDAAVPPQPL